MKRNRHRSGTTLTELIVALLLSAILLTMTAGIISPAAKLFTRLYRLWSAQLILDNTVQELRSITADASGYVKLYDTCGPDQTTADRTGEDSGAALEFGNADGLVVLVSGVGCPDKEICLGSGNIDVTASADISPGSLLVRYYAREAGKQYLCENAAGKARARAVRQAFADPYYMGNYLEMTFSYPAGTGQGDEFHYLNTAVRLYSDEEKTQLIAQDEVILSFRYRVIRENAVTAIREPPEGSP